ncbi:MAG: class I SAM-dependent methyltransferase [Gemmataceae bacterium]|nr:class I SAM-dependent methyltransferase [Gemmataceae bacterium]
MNPQDQSWSEAAAWYEREFIDPHLPGVRSPLRRALLALAKRGAKVVGDLGCGIGPLLPLLAKKFEQVVAVDFAEGMLNRAREKASDRRNVRFVQASMTDLKELEGQLDVAVSINSLVMPDVREQEKALRSIRAALKPDGWVLGILPAMDGVHYVTSLLLDRALESGKPIDLARKNAAHLNDHADYDFAFGQFRFQGLEQHFWQPYEIRYRFRRSGFRVVQQKKVRLSWKQFAGWRELKKYPAPWDWFFLARPDVTMEASQ